MKKIVMIVLVAIFTTGLYAQNNFFAQRKGMVLTYREYDAQKRTTGHSVMTIKDVKGSGKNMTITYGMESLDSNRKRPKDSIGERLLKVEIKNDILFINMNHFIPADMSQQGVKMEITGNVPMELPSNLKAGDKLKNASVTMTMDLGIMKTTNVFKMTDGKCLAVEDVTVPAGKFKCHKITQTVSTSAMGVNIVTRTVSWYSPGFGTVKQEIYDSKNNLTSTTELIETKG